MKLSVALEVIRIIELGAAQWLDAAAACNDVIPILASEEERRKWELRAQSYLAHAEINRALIEVIRAETESHR